MYFVDTHTHLFVNQFDADREEVLESAVKQGITKIILPAICSSDHAILKDMKQKYPKLCHIAGGLHPTEVAENFEEEWQKVEKFLQKEDCIAIGETGIDLYWSDTYKELQQESFERHVLRAKQDKLPIIIHVRNSFKEVFEIIDKHNDEDLRGIFHSFTGDFRQAQKIIDYTGFKIGLNGILTFKNSGLDEIVRKIDLKHIVLETDAPYLAPVPKRGKRNESAYLIYTAKKLAEIKSLPLETIAEATSSNAIDIFGDILTDSNNN